MRLRRERLERVRRGSDVVLGHGVRLQAAPGAEIVLGDGCLIGAGTRIVVQSGRVELGEGVLLGERCTLVAHSGIAIGAGAQLAHETVIVDFDHVIEDVEQPIRVQPLISAPVTIGAGARIGLGASVLRGVSVGAGAIVEPRAVVTRDVPAGGHVGGVPARPVTAEPLATEPPDPG
jgi:acetyltransferase-like isoleucine patch superfamily enzyme